MTTPLHTKVPLDIHPDVLSVHDEVFENSPGAYILESAKAVLAGVYQWHADVEDADLAFQAMGAKEHMRQKQPAEYGRYQLGTTKRVFHGNETEVFNAATEAQQPVIRAVDRHRKEVESYREQIARATDKALEAPELRNAAGVAISQEVRNHLRNIAPAGAAHGVKALEFMQQAIKNGDKLTVASVLAAPPYLSGLTAEDHAMWRTEAELAWAPQQHKERLALEAISDRVEAAGQKAILRGIALQKTMNASMSARKHASAAMKKLRGERLAK